MPDLPDRFTAAKLEPMLTTFNDKWSRRLQTFRSVHPALANISNRETTTATTRAWQSWLPVDEYFDDLHSLLLQVLQPHELPTALISQPYESLPGLWRELPEMFGQELTMGVPKLFEMACSIAAPPRFGTATGRYPHQLDWLRQHADLLPQEFFALDYGCGTGQGTYELAKCLEDIGKHGAILGVTLEWLEVWMGNHRQTPHLPPIPAHEYPRVKDVSIDFAVGDLITFQPPKRADMIFCNGLIGGPNLNHAGSYPMLWEKISEELRPGGIFLADNRFHDGHSQSIEHFNSLHPDCFSLLPSQKRNYFLMRN